MAKNTEPMERVIDRLRKIAALAERGSAGESAAAAAILEKELVHYGLSMEDILDNVRRQRTFRYANQNELQLLALIVRNVTGSRSEAFKKMYFSRSLKTACVSLTNMEYIDVEGMFAYYRKVYDAELKKETERAKEAFVIAFTAKYDLWDKDIAELKGGALTGEDMEYIERARSIIRSMKSDPFRKMIGG